jgi:Ca2+-binding EF-hand superfamily protein
MKRAILTLSGLALALATFTAVAQDADTRPARKSGPGGPPEAGRRQAPQPIMSIFDTNHDGVLSAQEIAGAATALYNLDKDQDGQITVKEFCAQGRARRSGGRNAPPANVPPCFTLFDKNGDGVLSSQEIADASSVLKTLDKNQDGQITADEIRPGRGPAGRGPRGGGRIGRRHAPSVEPSAAQVPDREPPRERR